MLDSQLQPSPSPLNKKRYWRSVFVFLTLVIVALAGVFISFVYDSIQGRRNVERVAQALKELEQKNYADALQDTYGGKTPQETLQLYINAVEKGDYELASKYFIRDKQSDSLLELKSSSNNELLVSILSKSQPWKSSLDQPTFTMESKIEGKPPFFVRFLKYPNSIWKIVEI